MKSFSSLQVYSAVYAKLDCLRLYQAFSQLKKAVAASRKLEQIAAWKDWELKRKVVVGLKGVLLESRLEKNRKLRSLNAIKASAMESKA